MNPLTTTRAYVARHKLVTTLCGLLLIAVAATALLGSGIADRTSRIDALDHQLATVTADRDAALAVAASQKQRADKAEGTIAAAQAAADKATADADARQAALDEREKTVADREAAVTATEQHIAETSINDGTWTVGRDVQPGTYTTAEAVSGQCYWAIYRSGTNGSDIVENDIVTGGFPTVNLSAGQDFTSERCGTWHQQ